MSALRGLLTASKRGILGKGVGGTSSGGAGWGFLLNWRYA